jgi:hypothetical protein
VQAARTAARAATRKEATVAIDPAVEKAVNDVFATEGYVKQDGGRDYDKMRQAAYIVLTATKVLHKKERAEKATTKGSLVKQVFPSLPDPGQFADESDPDLAAAVWDNCQQRVWGEAKSDATGKLQILVGSQMGNGYVLCRTKVGDDQTDAAYVTDDRACIEEDLVTPENRALERKLRAVVNNRTMLIYRQPQYAKRWKQTFDGHLKAISAAGSGQLALAIEGVTAEPATVDDDEE